MLLFPQQQGRILQLRVQEQQKLPGLENIWFSWEIVS